MALYSDGYTTLIASMCWPMTAMSSGVGTPTAAVRNSDDFDSSFCFAFKWSRTVYRHANRSHISYVVKRVDDAPGGLRHDARRHLPVWLSVRLVRLLHGHIRRRHLLELVHDFLLTNTGRRNAAPCITVA